MNISGMQTTTVAIGRDGQKFFVMATIQVPGLGDMEIGPSDYLLHPDVCEALLSAVNERIEDALNPLQNFRPGGTI